jgi:hypothetical protein
MVGLTLSKKTIDAIVFFEVSSEAYYNSALKNPIWPGGASGVTIGVGYDLGHNSVAQIKSDWGKYINPINLSLLCSVAGLKGTDAKIALPKVKLVSIPFASAKEVFINKTITRFSGVAKTSYPGIESLFPDAQGALVSLVFNRGGLIDSSDRRKEMKAIQELVTKKDYTGIAAQIRNMKRLWDPNTQPGLLARREKEAQLVQTSNRNYVEAEKIQL